MKFLASVLLVVLSLSQARADFLSECPESIRNWFLCARHLEQKIRSENPEVFRRTIKDELVISLKNGKYKIYRDQEHSSYAIPTYLKDVGYVLVFVQHYEGGTYYLLNLENGAEFEAEGYPIVSPDKSRIVVFQKDIDAHYVKNVLRVYRIGRLGLVLDFNTYPGDWGPSDVRWVGNNEILFSKDSIDKINPGYYEIKETKHLKLRDGKWQIE